VTSNTIFLLGTREYRDYNVWCIKFLWKN
jgi:hypothetical protein